MNDERSPLWPFFTPYPRFARAALVFFLLSAFVGPASAVADLLDRASDPVIPGGAALDRLLGVDPDRIVAFEYSFITGIVVVSSADRPMTEASCSWAASTKRLGRTLVPRSITSNPAHRSMLPTRFLPIS